jgi:outer membrane receptor protein involved in Fe transport
MRNTHPAVRISTFKTSAFNVSAFNVPTLSIVPWLFGAIAAAGSADVLAQSSSGKLEEIVVTSRRREERLDDVPVAVAAISAESLQKYAVSDISAVTQMVPSMVVGRQVTGSSASIFLRGVGSTSLSSGFDQSVSLNLDGIAMSRGREIVSALYDIAQVEVMKGPQALFFGKNSTGGVINISSKMPTREFEGSLKAGYETEAKERFVEGVLSGPITNDLAGRFAMRASRMDGFFDNSAQANTVGGFYREPNSDKRPETNDLSGRFTLDFAPADSDLQLVFRASATQYEDSGAADNYERLCAGGGLNALGVPRPTSGIAEPYADCRINGRNSTANANLANVATMRYSRNGQTYTDHDAYNTSLTAEYAFERWSLTSVTGAYGFKQQDLNSFSGATAGSYVTQYAKFDQLSQELRLLSDFDSPLNVMIGAYLAKTNFIFNTDAFAAAASASRFDPLTGNYYTFGRDNGFDGSTQSAFTELTWAITDDLEFAGGARWTREHKTSYAHATYANPFVPGFGMQQFDDRFSDINVSPQATLTWKPTADLMFYAAYKEGFKSGGYNTSISILSTTQEGDGQFESETAKGFELGTKSTFFDGTLRLGATLYDYDYDDLQVQVFDAATTGSRVANVGTLNTRGVEVEANLLVPHVDGLELHGAVNYNDATYEDYIGSCYTGQTIVEGCNQTFVGTTFRNQDYDGHTPPKAPLWSGQMGFSYKWPVFADLQATFTADASYTDEYNFTDTLRPDGVQDSFWRYDASIRVTNSSEDWEVALIGRNLSDELVVTSANDMPGQPVGGTGTAVGTRSDMNAIVERPRQVILQGTLRF